MAMWVGIVVAVGVATLPGFQPISVGADPTPAVPEPGGFASFHPEAVDPTDGLFGVSCVSNQICLAVGTTGKVYAVGAQDQVGEMGTANTPVFGVSCESATFCLLVANTTAFLIRQSGVAKHVLDSNPTVEVHWVSASCPTKSFCAVGGGLLSGRHKNAGIVATWANGRWSGVKIVDPPIRGNPPTFVSSLSCIGPKFCVGADGNGRTLQWNGQRWFFPHLLNHSVATDLVSVSCTATTFCMAMGSDPRYVATWNGTKWKFDSKPHAIGHYDWVSCSSSHFCASVDSKGYAEGWNGHVWTLSRLIDPGGYFVAISCTPADLCVAVDAEGNAVVIEKAGGHVRGPVNCAHFGCVTKVVV